MKTSDGTVAFTGQTAFRKAADNVETAWANQTPNGNFLGSDVFECDFSSFATPGDRKSVV